MQKQSDVTRRRVPSGCDQSIGQVIYYEASNPASPASSLTSKTKPRTLLIPDIYSYMAVDGRLLFRSFNFSSQIYQKH